jgi:psp operon transcriptional activator
MWWSARSIAGASGASRLPRWCSTPFESPWKPAVALAGAPAEDGAAPAIIPTGLPQPTGEGDIDLRAAVEAHERAILEATLARHRYNQRQTAKALGLSYDQLRHTLRKHGLTERG